MKIVMTVQEIFVRGIWQKVCQIRNINEWALNEGQISSDEELTFAEEEARELGIIK